MYIQNTLENSAKYFRKRIEKKKRKTEKKKSSVWI